jgi:hypothetical protein
LAERVPTPTHYIGQIEVGNKFPSPEMLERIAAALEIDRPPLFSMKTLTEEAVSGGCFVRYRGGYGTGP